MAYYTVYNLTTGEIFCTGECPASHISLQANTDENLGVIEGTGNPATQKVDLISLSLINKTEAEQLTYNYNEVAGQFPELSDINDITDVVLNARIEEFYLNQVTASNWRITNYVRLRKAAYSSLADRADAAVKIASGDTTLINEGEVQLAALNAHDLTVKTRFPKS